MLKKLTNSTTSTDQDEVSNISIHEQANNTKCQTIHKLLYYHPGIDTFMYPDPKQRVQSLNLLKDGLLKSISMQEIVEFGNAVDFLERPFALRFVMADSQFLLISYTSRQFVRLFHKLNIARELSLDLDLRVPNPVDYSFPRRLVRRVSPQMTGDSMVLSPEASGARASDSAGTSSSAESGNGDADRRRSAAGTRQTRNHRRMNSVASEESDFMDIQLEHEIEESLQNENQDQLSELPPSSHTSSPTTQNATFTATLQPVSEEESEPVSFSNDSNDNVSTCLEQPHISQNHRKSTSSNATDRSCSTVSDDSIFSIEGELGRSGTRCTEVSIPVSDSADDKVNDIPVHISTSSSIAIPIPVSVSSDKNMNLDPFSTNPVSPTTTTILAPQTTENPTSTSTPSSPETTTTTESTEEQPKEPLPQSKSSQERQQHVNGCSSRLTQRQYRELIYCLKCMRICRSRLDDFDYSPNSNSNFTSSSTSISTSTRASRRDTGKTKKRGALLGYALGRSAGYGSGSRFGFGGPVDEDDDEDDDLETMLFGNGRCTGGGSVRGPAGDDEVGEFAATAFSYYCGGF
ncbi:unnamed protein product [Ambrosiozyma monospora]|uniref:Unnamed protein product n=1 Tax=Ambrosiozyma monospora TaxID=43982 RepID=A0ACB5T7R3_AMBMO|nr:unnamed protein product [Ambrosiozyma monospora]